MRRVNICTTRSISLSRPTTGSSLPSCAILVMSVPKLSRTGVLLFPADGCPEVSSPVESAPLISNCLSPEGVSPLPYPSMIVPHIFSIVRPCSCRMCCRGLPWSFTMAFSRCSVSTTAECCALASSMVRRISRLASAVRSIGRFPGRPLWPCSRMTLSKCSLSDVRSGWMAVIMLLALLTF